MIPRNPNASNAPPNKPAPEEKSATLVHPDGTAAQNLQPTQAIHGQASDPTLVQGLPNMKGYEIIAELGRGGMGVVYKANQAGLNRLVALKMILSGTHSSAEERKRFYLEAEAIAKLRHPHVVQIYEVGERDGCPCFSLEYVDGGSLAQYLRGRPQPARESGALVEKLAMAVQAAHERGIIHRDLKPGNVLLERIDKASDASSLLGLSPKITDFGLAKQTDRQIGQTASGAILGTPDYMAPEQAGGRTQVGPAADIYALGTILYELLTGRPPFRAPAPLDTLRQVRELEPEAPSRIQPGVPRDLETICLKCLQKEPGRRYGTAALLAEDLCRFQAGEPIAARPVSMVERFGRWCRRQPLVAALTLGIALSLLLGIVVAGYLARVAWREAKAAFVEAKRSDQEADNAKQSELAAQKARVLAEMQEKNAKRRFHAAQINVAQHAWRDSQVAHMLTLLDTLLPGPEEKSDPRGFEWHYLNKLAHRDRLTLQGHGDLIHSVAYSPDGKLLATGGYDHTIRLWDTTNGKAVRTIPTENGHFFSLAFSPDGARLAGAAAMVRPKAKNGVTVWEVQTGKEVLAGSIGSVGVAWSPDGKLLAVSNDQGDKVNLLDASTGRSMGELFDASYRPMISRGDKYRGLAFSPDGKLLAVTVRPRNFMSPKAKRMSPTVQIWDLTTQRAAVTLQDHQSWEDLGSVAFSHDGRLFATGGDNGIIYVYDVATWRVRHIMRGHTGWITCLSFSADNQLLAACNYTWPDGGHRQRIVKLWDTVTGEERGVLRGHTATITEVAFSPTGTQLATASFDRTAKIWEMSAAQDADNLYQGSQYIEAITASGNGKYLAWSQTGTQPPQAIKLFDLVSRRVIRQIEFEAGALALSQDGRWLAARGSSYSRMQKDELKVWDTQSGQPPLSLGAVNGILNKPVFSSDGTHLAAARGTDVLIWSPSSGQLLFTLPGGKSPVTILSMSPDGRWLASGSTSMVILWDLHKQQPHHKFSLSDSIFTALTFSLDSKSLACAVGNVDRGAILSNRIHVWDTSSLEERLSFTGHTQGVMGLAFSPDGGRLATASLDRTVKVWDSHVGQLMLTLEGHEGGVHSLFFTPDNRLISADKPIPNSVAPPLGWPSGTRYSIKLWDGS